MVHAMIDAVVDEMAEVPPPSQKKCYYGNCCAPIAGTSANEPITICLLYTSSDEQGVAARRQTSVVNPLLTGSTTHTHQSTLGPITTCP